MATKAKTQDVKYLGFAWEMFSPADVEEEGFDDFIQGALDENVDRIKDVIGSSAYDNAARLSDIKKIEKYLAAAELWRRRANIVQGNAMLDGPTGSSELKKAEACEKTAQAVMDRLNDNSGTPGLAVGNVVTSHFSQDS